MPLGIDVDDITRAPFNRTSFAFIASELKDPKALEFAENAYRLAPNYPPILDTLGWLLVQKGDLTRGQELLRKAADLSPSNVEIRIHVAQAHAKAGRRDEARKELETISKDAEKIGRGAEVAALLKEL